MKKIFKMWWDGVLIMTGGSVLGAYLYSLCLGVVIFGLLTFLGVF